METLRHHPHPHPGQRGKVTAADTRGPSTAISIRGTLDGSVGGTPVTINAQGQRVDVRIGLSLRAVRHLRRSRRALQHLPTRVRTTLTSGDLAFRVKLGPLPYITARL